LDYLKNEARFRNLAVLELAFRKVILGKLTATGFMHDDESEI